MLLDIYTRTQMRSILKSVGVEINSETGTDFLCLCPFHSNRHTPSFAVSYSKGLYVCYNPSCDAAGTILDLVKEVGRLNDYEAIRLINSHKVDTEKTFDDQLADLLDDKPEFVEFPQSKLDELHKELCNSQVAKDYFKTRGIGEDSIQHFKLGYSDSQGMVTVPIHSPDGTPVGLVGRSISEKKFKNSTQLPKNKTMFNIHRAKREGGTIIVTESCFDAIKLYEAGYPNGVATLGGSMSNENIETLNKYATKIIIATDNDEAGRKLGQIIVDKLRNKDVYWASMGYGIVYPEGKKDLGDLNNDEIIQCIKNAVPHFEYANW